MSIIKPFLLGMFSVFLVIQVLSASTYLNIYLDGTGSAEFLGETNETNETLNLSQGIFIIDGKVYGVTQELTSKFGDSWTFSYFFPNSDIKVILPNGAKIKNFSQGELFIERNRIVVYFQNNSSIEYTLESSKKSLIYVVIFSLIFILIGIMVYFYRKKIINLFTKKRILKKVKNKKKENKLSIIKQVLNDREKLIIDRLEATGKIKMSRLRKICDIPKASFSRHIQELEKKKIIKRIGEGKNKFIELLK